jgi:Xaa-Pro aminopeptidase
MAARRIAGMQVPERLRPATKVFRDRVARVRSSFRRHGISALLVVDAAPLRYLTGFTGSNGLLILRSSTARLYTDGRYQEQARHEAGRVAAVHVVAGGLFEAAVREGGLRYCRVLGYDDRTFSNRHYKEVRRLLPSTRLVAVPGLVEQLAAVKDRAELTSLAAAAAISDRVFREILPLLRPGVRERDVALEISYRQGKLGAERDSFEPIVASGPRSAMPHAKASDRPIARGDAVLMDFGCVVEGYGSDITRTVFVGRPHPELKRLYGLVLEAQARARDAVQAGVPGRVLDALARGVIARAGYEKYFPHSLGHGIGLNVHELPRIAPASRDLLTAGNVITIEPGVYLPGVGGIRIEDDVVVQEGGSTLLTHSSRDLIQL